MRHKFQGARAETLKVASPSVSSTLRQQHLNALSNLKKRTHQHFLSHHHHQQLISNSALVYICILVSSVSTQFLYNLNGSNYSNHNHRAYDDRQVHVNCNHLEHSEKSHHLHRHSQHLSAIAESNNEAAKAVGSRQRNLAYRSASASLTPPAQSVPDSIYRSQRQSLASHSDHVEPSPHTRPCDGCLAIPLVAILGNRQVNGFIIPQLRKQLPRTTSQYLTTPSRRQMMRDVGNGGYRASYKPALGGYHYATSSCATMTPSYGTSAMPNTHPLEPQSDEKCPMTGPLTVCDQIGSYPEDVILHKLELAKKSLKSSCFNIDSLFSDERDHSKEPFGETSMPMTSVRHSSSHSGGGTAAAVVIGSGGGGINESNIGETTSNKTSLRKGAAKVDQAYAKTVVIGDYEPQVLNEDPMQTATKLGFSSQMRDPPVNPGNPVVQAEYTAYSKDRSDGRRTQNGPFAGVADDFVELVEQQALSLEAQETTDDLAMGRHEAETNRFSGPTSASFISAPTNGSSLADRLLLSLSRSSDQDPNISSVGGGGSGSYGSGGGSKGGGVPQRRLQKQHIGHLEQTNALPQLKTFNTVSNLQLRPVAKRAGELPLTRHRRQTSAAAAAAATAETPGERSSGELNPESVSDSADGETQPEPLCRVKSIYISPKAALNDKKQWRYVVNAPERNPQIRQIIRVDICEDPFGPCSEQVSLPFGFTSQCKQKYSKKKLLALDSDTGQLEVDTFFIPSCCVCQLIRSPQPVEEPALSDGVRDDPSSLEDTTEPNSNA